MLNSPRSDQHTMERGFTQHSVSHDNLHLLHLSVVFGVVQMVKVRRSNSEISSFLSWFSRLQRTRIFLLTHLPERKTKNPIRTWSQCSSSRGSLVRRVVETLFCLLVITAMFVDHPVIPLWSSSGLSTSSEGQSNRLKCEHVVSLCSLSNLGRLGKSFDLHPTLSATRRLTWTYLNSDIEQIIWSGEESCLCHVIQTLLIGSLPT